MNKIPILINAVYILREPNIFKLISSPINDSIYSSNYQKAEIQFLPVRNKLYLDSLVVVYQVNSCLDTLFIGLKGNGKGEITFCLPDTTGKIGDEHFKIPLKMKLSPDTLNYISISYTAEISFGARFFLPDENVNSAITENKIVDGERILKIEQSELNITGAETVLTEISGLVLLGDAKETQLIIRSFSWSKPYFVERENGNLHIKGICQPRISPVMSFEPINIYVEPNPASDEVEIKVRGDFNGYYSVGIYTIEGYKISEFEGFRQYPKGDNQKHIFKLHVNNFSSGLYQIILQTNFEMRSKPLMIVK